VPSAWKTISNDSSLRRITKSRGTPSTIGNPSHHCVIGMSSALIARSTPTWFSSASTMLPPTSSGKTIVRMSCVRSQVSLSNVRQRGNA